MTTTPVGVALPSGYRVVVTGAAGVIGGWIADAFARRGAALLLSDEREDRLGEERQTGRWAGADVRLHRTDLRDLESIEDLVTVTAEHFGSPDALVNNAGVYPHAPMLDVSAAEWDRVMAVNLTAPFLLTQGIARLMIAEGRAGSIVNIASGAALTVTVTGVPYSVSKAGLVMLTRGAALALAPYRIRVNAVGPGFAPGSAVTPLDDAYVSSMTAAIPLGRSSGPHDAPELVVYLCSAAAEFITGTFINVDGGRTAGPVIR